METVTSTCTRTTNLASLMTTAPPPVTTQRDTNNMASAPPLQEPQQHLSPIAHRRWKVNISVDFLTDVKHVDIVTAHTNEDRMVVYELDVHLKRSTSRLSTPQREFVVERSFSDFADLRESVKCAVSATPPCTCEYWLELLIYVRFSLTQPRGVIKFIAGTEKCKKILAQFVGDLVVLGRRRVEKVGNRECEAQLVIPGLLETFLLGASKTTRPA
ncbi:unnamed protein product [Phytophthora fragariaefolia]|uniref:Unnamed protein product n=1 Tax=Phytophthora fragariaefolia TaxID=1490495 RepID=A0A9W6XBX2_9STRA|nr:unnamed protein product [Phytophthora fragariaefolia]